MKVHISDVDNIPAACYDTGLDPRSFARTKMSQSMIEIGYLVHPDGSHEVWRSAGVKEVNNHMRVWGPLFNGKRLDQVIDQKGIQQQESLEAVIFWIRAKMFLGETHSTLNPGAAFICYEDSKDGAHPKGSVFFSPDHLSNRCLYIEGLEIDRYNCPDLLGIDAAAFCAAVMLYKIFSGAHPYPSAEIFQDMREGIFLPLRLTAPELDEKLSALIDEALLLPVDKKRTSKSGVDILSEILKMLMNKEGKVADVSSLFHTLSAEEKQQREKEKKLFQFKQNSVVKTKRFAMRNKYVLMGVGAGLAFTLIIVFSTVRGVTQRWTTADMTSEQVIAAYYDAFSSLDHPRMEACIQGADKSDIHVAINLYAVSRTRQAYENSSNISIIPARVWRETGGELPSPNAFGVTDLSITYESGHENEQLIIYRADYVLWSPIDDYPRHRSDILTLKRDNRKHWRIIEILRTEN